MKALSPHFIRDIGNKPFPDLCAQVGLITLQYQETVFDVRRRWRKKLGGIVALHPTAEEGRRINNVREVITRE